MRFSAVVLAAALAATTLLSAQTSSPKQLSTDELRRYLEQKGKFVYLDVRESKELEELGTVKNHIHIPLGQLEKRMNELPKDKLIITL